MKNKIIIIVVIVLFTVIGVIGFLGVPKEICLKDENYKSCYIDYYMYPYLYNYWDCYNFLSLWPLKTPCGIDVNLDKENAFAGLLEQLCADKTNNKQKIIDRYKNNNTFSNDIEFICNEGTKIYSNL